MKKKILLFIFLLFGYTAFAQYVVKGGSGDPLLAKEDTPNLVYMLNGLSGAEISYTSTSPGTHQWYKYTRTATDAVPVASQQVGNTSTITDVENNCGYFVGSPTLPSTRFVWIIDYSPLVPVFNSLIFDDNADDKCDLLKIVADVTASPIYYYTAAGVRKEIERTYTLKYQTLEWDEENKIFRDKAENYGKTGIVSEIIIDSPLKNTDFELTGDNFAVYFKMGKSIKTPVYEAIAVESHVAVEQDGKPLEINAGDNVEESATVNMTFTAYANEPVASAYLWKIYYKKTKEESFPSSPEARTENPILQHEFKYSGIYKVNLEVSNRTSVCIDTSQYFTITISDFYLFVPNAFSPDSSPEINDVFKVSYKSIISFQGWIFNRWGNELFQWTNPDEGWDGKYRGKFVPSGVYFYVIKVVGADGKTHTRKGDVNILRAKE